jgi:hypothetical protein
VFDFGPVLLYVCVVNGIQTLTGDYIMPTRTGKREPAIIAGIGFLNGHIRFVSSSRSDALQSVLALHPQDADGQRVTQSSFTLYRLPEAMERAEALAWVGEQYKANTPEHAFLKAEHEAQVRRDAPKAAVRPGQKGKRATNWFTPPTVDVTVEKTSKKRTAVSKPDTATEAVTA